MNRTPLHSSVFPAKWRHNPAALLLLLSALIVGLMTVPARAEPSDISAAARGVVRVVIIGSDSAEVFPVSHGTGFAVTGKYIVTNAHVVRDAEFDPSLRIAIVPSEGNDPAFAELVAYSPGNDLALLRITGKLSLPRLAIAAGIESETGEVTALGYPANVDRAQGLELRDVLRSQPPVKSRGYLSGQRPSRDIDTVLHSAPVARGSSGGPLLDSCGRVIGVNSFSSDSGGVDAEFYFAISNRELLPFLRRNGVKPTVNGSMCRSLAEIEAEERAALEQQRARAEANDAEAAKALGKKRQAALRKAEWSVITERDNRMGGAGLLMLLAFGLGLYGLHQRGREDGRTRAILSGIGAFGAVIGAGYLWLSRPDIDDVDARAEALIREADAKAARLNGTDGTDGAASTDAGNAASARSQEGAYLCTLDPSRSRVTSSKTQDIALSWAAGGCVNARTQYGYDQGTWSRVFVPNSEEVVSVNRYDPARREFITERYLLGRSAMTKAREARGTYKAPACGAEKAAVQALGASQSAILKQLPQRPNERLVYRCTPAKAEN